MVGFSLIFVILPQKLTKYMKYYEVEFTISPLSADAADLLASLAGEAFASVSTISPLRAHLLYIMYAKLRIATGTSSGNRKVSSR